jgi:agmatinase
VAGGFVDAEMFSKLVPYSGVPTFARLEESRNLDGVDIAVYGMPFDLGTTNRPGARFGPRAIRDASLFVGALSVPPPHDASRYETIRAIDYGDIAYLPASIDDFLAKTHEHVGRIVAAGATPLGLGGDHLCAYPEVKAVAEKYGTISLVHFDAHADDYDLPGPLNHGSMFWHLVEEGIVDPTTSAQIAIRHTYPSHDFNVIDGHRCAHMTGAEIAAEVRQHVGDTPVFVTLDVDGMDPAHTPGTGTPYPGGLTSAQQREILHGLIGINAVGGDVVEVAPAYDPNGTTPIVAATVALDIGVILMEARAIRGDWTP